MRVSLAPKHLRYGPGPGRRDRGRAGAVGGGARAWCSAASAAEMGSRRPIVPGAATMFGPRGACLAGEPVRCSSATPAITAC